jgi:histidine triad (HIT) family protein
MEGCIFCKIISKEIPAEIEKETDTLLVFKDASPKASIHLLIVPKTHYNDISKLPEKEWIHIKDMAEQLGLEHKLKGYRIINNAGDAALVKHMHMHFLGEVDKKRQL